MTTEMGMQPGYTRPLPPPLEEQLDGIGFQFPTIQSQKEAASLPEEILGSSRKHFGREVLWQPENELYASMVKQVRVPPKVDFPDKLWFFVTSDWDVFSNVGTLEEWWRLGNLKVDSIKSIMRRFEQDEVPGLQVFFHYPPDELVREYGDPRGTRIYSTAGDLMSLYLGKYCEDLWRKRAYSGDARP